MKPCSLFILLFVTSINICSQNKFDKNDSDSLNDKNSFFLGNYKRHDNFGGLRITGGYSSVNYNAILPYGIKSGFNLGLYYNNSKVYPITIGMDFINGGLNYSYVYQLYGDYSIYPFNSNHFSINIGLGYIIDGYYVIYDGISIPTKKELVFRPGCSIMAGEYGGFVYNYQVGSKSKFFASSHSISYVFGRKMSKGIILAAGITTVLIFIHDLIAFKNGNPTIL